MIEKRRRPHRTRAEVLSFLLMVIVPTGTTAVVGERRSYEISAVSRNHHPLRGSRQHLYSRSHTRRRDRSDERERTPERVRARDSLEQRCR